MSIQYFNQFNEKISETQSQVLGEFSRQTVEGNRIKKEEHFKDGNVVQVDYFLSANESQNVIRQQYPTSELVFYKNEEIHGIYRKYDVEYVELDGSISGKRIQVYSDNIYPIYDKAIDVITGQTLFFEKSYYDETNDLTYEFEYNMDGSFSRLTIYDPTNFVDTKKRTLSPADIGVGNNLYNFSWQGFEYYQNAEPVIPS